MVRIDVRYEGGLRTRAVHGPSGTELITDAPVDNRGLGRSFSPTDLLGTAIGTCMLTLMGIAAQDRGLELAGASASVEKHMVATPRRRIGRLVVEIVVPQDPGPDGRRVLEAAARGCPVSASLAPEVAVELTFRWGA
ncbi:MAG TPA: OsmC family protein [Planctomycetota bacterium]|nr:OsmC family protein [Planctomycetota bacterium]